MKAIGLLVLLVAVGLSSDAAKLPDTFKKCRRRDDQNTCLAAAIEKALKAMKDGIPSLQLLPIDPLAVSQISLQEGGNRPINVHLDLLDSQVTGLYGVEVLGTRYNLTERLFDIEVYLPFLSLSGDYIMDGRFLLLPLKGKGKCVLTLSKFKTNFLLKGSPLKKNKGLYWDVDVKLKIYDVTNFKVNFENLFNGDKALGDSTNRALNENWSEFWGVIRPSMEVAFGNIFASVANVIFSRVQEKDIFTD